MSKEEAEQGPTYREILASSRIPFSSWYGSVCETLCSSFINDFGSYTLQQLVMIRSTTGVGYSRFSHIIYRFALLSSLQA